MSYMYVIHVYVHVYHVYVCACVCACVHVRTQPLFQNMWYNTITAKGESQNLSSSAAIDYVIRGC